MNEIIYFVSLEKPEGPWPAAGGAGVLGVTHSLG